MNNFHTTPEKKIINQFNRNGYYIFNINNKNKLKKIKNKILELSKKFLKKTIIKKNFFEKTHEYITYNELNSYRMNIYSLLNSYKWFKESYYEMAKDELAIICGNELVMQRKINLSIQLPKDDSSLLPLHSDVWSGCSPYELVLWIPLVDCKKTNSMFILPKKINERSYREMKKFRSVFDLEKKTKKYAKWLNIRFGQGLIFLHSIMHGNKVNQEKSTRWSFNCRFKSVFSPYDEKSLGETFLPITLKPVSLHAMNYEEPEIRSKSF
jgi:hypothetical protein